MDAEKAEIVAGANAGDEQEPLRFGGGGLFDHGIDAIQIAARQDAAAADGSVAREQALARGLDTTDRAAFFAGKFYQTLRRWLRGGADVEMVSHHVQKRVGAGKGTGAMDGMAVAAGLGLRNKSNR